MNMSSAADVVSEWRNEAGEDNPAGPLYSHGIYAEADIVSEASDLTGRPCGSTGCTGSRTTLCC